VTRHRVRSAACLALAFLLAVSATGSSANHPAPVRAVTDARPLLSAFGVANIDGTLSPGEWDRAARFELFPRLPRATYGSDIGVGTIPAVLFVMNDEHDLYVAIRIGRLTDQAGIVMAFDNDDDGVAVEAGDDSIRAARTPDAFSFTDGSWVPCAPPGAATSTWCGVDDTTTGRGYPAVGTVDGTAAGSRPDETQVFELSHPLDSADDTRDFSLHVGSVVGFQAVVQLGEVRAPAVCGTDACGAGGSGYGRIEIAAPDATPLAAGPTVTATLSPIAATAGWRRGTTTVRVAGIATSDSPVAGIRVWGAPAATTALGGQALARTGNAAHRVFAEGVTIVHAYAVDRDGRPGPWLSLPVRVDGTLPTVTPPRIVFRAGGIVGGSPVATLVTWVGADAHSGVAGYELQESLGGGGWTAVASGGASITAVARRLRIGTLYRYRVRAIDVAGNVGRWVAGPSYRVSLVDSTSGRIELAGPWRRSRDGDAVGGSTTYASTAGATARLTFDGSAIALVAPSGGARGVAEVALDGSRFAGPKRIDLGSPDATARVVYREEWSGAGRHVIEVRLEGTVARPRVDLDAFLVATTVRPAGGTTGGRPELSFEAEALGREGDVSEYPYVAIMSGYGRGLWGNGRQLTWPARLGEKLDLVVPLTPGRWTVWLYATRQPGSGQVQASFAGPLGPPTDLYAASVAPTGAIRLGTIASSWAQVQRITLSVTGRNAASSGYLIGIDRLVLTPAD
jgi:hypothetical protein